MTDAPPCDPDLRAHPGLHAIAVFEAGKGLLALLAAGGLELLGPAVLQRRLHGFATHVQLDPQQGALAGLSRALDPDSVHLAAAVGLIYALMRFIEAWGLWRARSWASWLGCVGAAVYLPLDLYALARHPGSFALAVLALNLLVVWILSRDLIERRRVAAHARLLDGRVPEMR